MGLCPTDASPARTLSSPHRVAAAWLVTMKFVAAVTRFLVFLICVVNILFLGFELMSVRYLPKKLRSEKNTMSLFH